MVELGTTLVVRDTTSQEAASNLINISDDVLTLSIDGTPRDFLESEVLRVTRPAHGLSRWWGALIGFGVGSLALAPVASCPGEGGCPPWDGIAGGVFIGSIAAGVLLTGRAPAEVLYAAAHLPPAVTLSLSPVRSGHGKGVAFALMW